jgi:hypothetical protein
MKFSEWINKNCQNISDFGVVDDIDSILDEYNTYLQEEQNKPVTSEFLLGLGFENYYSNFRIKNDKFEIEISISNKECIISDYKTDFDIYIPFLKTQKDVTDLMRLLDID